MIIIKRDRVTFYISDDSVVVSNGDFQHSSYNTFSMANKSNFYKFKSTILDSTYPAFSKIIDVQVFLKLENAGQVRDKIVEIKLNLPGKSILIKEIAQTFEAGIDLATDALKRQLVRFKEKTKK